MNMKCPKCGAENPEYAYYCGKCGKKLIKENYPHVNTLSIAGIVIGFAIPLAFLVALIPEIYLYTRPEDSAKRHGKKLIQATIILFVIMMIVWYLIDTLVLKKSFI